MKTAFHSPLFLCYDTYIGRKWLSSCSLIHLPGESQDLQYKKE